MPNPDYSATFLAGGDINPSRFVTKSTTDWGVTQATADAIIFGISQEGARDAPIPSASVLAAQSGESLKVYLDGAECTLDLGGTVTAGDELASDSTGQGVAVTPAATSRENVGAIALESGIDGDLRRVRVHRDAAHGTIFSS